MQSVGIGLDAISNGGLRVELHVLQAVDFNLGWASFAVAEVDILSEGFRQTSRAVAPALSAL